MCFALSAAQFGRGSAANWGWLSGIRYLVGAGLDFAVDSGAVCLARDAEVVSRLQAAPVFGLIAEIARQAQGGFGGNPPRLVLKDNIGDARRRNPQRQGQGVRGQPVRPHKAFDKNHAGPRRHSTRHPSIWRPGVQRREEHAEGGATRYRQSDDGTINLGLDQCLADHAEAAAMQRAIELMQRLADRSNR